MKIVIEANPKEIAALALELQRRSENSVDVENALRAVKESLISPPLKPELNFNQ